MSQDITFQGKHIGVGGGHFSYKSVVLCVYRGGETIGRKVEVLEVLRSFGDIFSQKLRLLGQKKHVKMASIRIFCDRFPCEIA